MKGIAVLLLLWLIAAMAIKNWADYWGRPSLPYFLTSLFLTPLVPTLVLLLQGKEQSLFEQSHCEGKVEALSAVRGSNTL